MRSLSKRVMNLLGMGERRVKVVTVGEKLRNRVIIGGEEVEL